MYITCTAFRYKLKPRYKLYDTIISVLKFQLTHIVFFCNKNYFSIITLFEVYKNAKSRLSILLSIFIKDGDQLVAVIFRKWYWRYCKCTFTIFQIDGNGGNGIIKNQGKLKEHKKLTTIILDLDVFNVMLTFNNAIESQAPT